VSPQEAAAIVGRFDAGGNFIDTANRYSGGQGERILGDLIRPDRDRGATVSLVRVERKSGQRDAGLAVSIGAGGCARRRRRAGFVSRPAADAVLGAQRRPIRVQGGGRCSVTA
jgi:hypothetical protein